MATETSWDYGWYGESFIITEENREGAPIRQIAIPNTVALAMVRTILSGDSRNGIPQDAIPASDRLAWERET